MLEGLEINIKIGKTEIVCDKSRTKTSKTQFWINNEENIFYLSPAIYATPDNIIYFLSKSVMETYNKNK